MSRDFLVVCHDKAEAATAAAVLGSARAQDGEPLFEVDRRENDLFAMLTYLHDIPPGFRMTIGGRQYDGFKKGVAFVAIKNGHHHGTGYFIDTGEHASQRPPSIPLAELKDRMMKAFDLEGGRDGRRAVTGAAAVRS